MSDLRRNTVHEAASVVDDPLAVAEAEARNGLLQFDYAQQVIMDAIDRKAFRLRPSLLLNLHREALQGLSSTAGTWRSGSVGISGGQHKPVEAHLIAEQVEDLCDHVNDNWHSKTALYLSAYVMWRLNLIHPFTDGNGRTSRMTSYVVLCAKIRAILPGTPTIPDQIVNNRMPYFEALEQADSGWATSRDIHLNKMERLLEDLLAQQLLNAQKAAGL